MAAPPFFLEIRKDFSSPQISGLIKPLISGERCRVQERICRALLLRSLQKYQLSSAAATKINNVIECLEFDVIWMMSETFHFPEKPGARHVTLFNAQSASFVSSFSSDVLLRPLNHRSAIIKFEPKKKIIVLSWQIWKVYECCRPPRAVRDKYLSTSVMNSVQTVIVSAANSKHKPKPHSSFKSVSDYLCPLDELCNSGGMFSFHLPNI